MRHLPLLDAYFRLVFCRLVPFNFCQGSNCFSEIGLLVGSSIFNCVEQTELKNGGVPQKRCRKKFIVTFSRLGTAKNLPFSRSWIGDNQFWQVIPQYLPDWMCGIAVHQM